MFTKYEHSLSTPKIWHVYDSDGKLLGAWKETLPRIMHLAVSFDQFFLNMGDSRIVESDSDYYDDIELAARHWFDFMIDENKKLLAEQN